MQGSCIPHLCGAPWGQSCHFFEHCRMVPAWDENPKGETQQRALWMAPENDLVVPGRKWGAFSPPFLTYSEFVAVLQTCVSGLLGLILSHEAGGPDHRCPPQPLSEHICRAKPDCGHWLPWVREEAGDRESEFSLGKAAPSELGSLTRPHWDTGKFTLSSGNEQSHLFF